MAGVCKYLTLSSSLRLEHKASMNLIQPVRYLASQLSSCQGFPVNFLFSSTVLLHVPIERSVLIFFSRVKPTLEQPGDSSLAHAENVSQPSAPSSLHLYDDVIDVSSVSHPNITLLLVLRVSEEFQTLSGRYIFELLSEINNCGSEEN